MGNGGKDFHFQIDSIFKEIDSSLSIYKDYSLISKLNNDISEIYKGKSIDEYLRVLPPGGSEILDK